MSVNLGVILLDGVPCIVFRNLRLSVGSIQLNLLHDQSAQTGSVFGAYARPVILGLGVRRAGKQYSFTQVVLAIQA